MSHHASNSDCIESEPGCSHSHECDGGKLLHREVGILMSHGQQLGSDVAFH